MSSCNNIRWIILRILLVTTSARGENGQTSEIDPGDPLFLTPYIARGKISEARKLAEVTFTEKFNVKSYAGFLTVNEMYNSNHFLWYFPAIRPKTADAPVLLWLQGGPGASSLFGLFEENGPIEIQNETFKYREINWAIDYHLIFIDNPVGTGFSFTNDSRGYCTDETQVGDQLYSTLIQFFKLFPELQKNPFFLTGESYAGKYVPSLAYTIENKNNNAELKINLFGMAIGNGYSDPINQIDYHSYLLQLGLIDFNQASVLEEIEKKSKNLIENEKWSEASKSNDYLIDLYMSMTGLVSPYNFLQTKSDHFANISLVIQENQVRKSLHVGNLTFGASSDLVYAYLTEDMPKSVAPLITEILDDNYCVLIYSGQLDVIVPYITSVNYLRKLNFTSADNYKNSKRTIWKVDDEVAGYIHQGGNLMEVLVRSASHMVPIDQPKWMHNLINMFVGNCTAKKTNANEESPADYLKWNQNNNKYERPNIIQSYVYVTRNRNSTR